MSGVKKRAAPSSPANGNAAHAKKAKTSSSSSSSSSDSKAEFKDPFDYLFGFGGEHCSEALEGALPADQNTPQKCPYNLYAEQLSGTSFTTPRARNQRSWVYRICPSAKHTPFKETPERNQRLMADFAKCEVSPNQLRWNPFPLPASEESVDFVSGMSTLMGSGSAETKTGMAIHVYACNTDMTYKQAFLNADGDFLIVPQLNALTIRTEFGVMQVAPWECCVIPRGVKFSVDLVNTGENARGYIAEIFTHSHFILPDLGPIGANGLADGRHFAHPVADYINEQGDDFRLVHKFMGKIFEAQMSSCAFDVVAFHGNYLPYKYDLRKYCVINSVKFDHLDPSIFTVLTCQTNEPGVAVLDFVIFPPRYAVQKDTFRPPYYHRNCMSEFMGNIAGQYEAKPDGFLPGGGSLHSIMSGHGPDADSYKKYTESDTSSPVMMPDTDLAFMFESTYMFKLTPYALEADKLQQNYYECWQGLENEFTPFHKKPTFSTK